MHKAKAGLVHDSKGAGYHFIMGYNLQQVRAGRQKAYGNSVDFSLFIQFQFFPE
jgi:hypothetical protein